MTLLPIILPKGYVAKVSVGDKVTAGFLLAKNTNSTTSGDIIIHLTKDFGISPKNVEKSLRKNIGDQIFEGDVIAVKKKMIGNTRILSKISGTISKIDADSGDVLVKAGSGVLDQTEDILSPVDGVVEICNNSKIVIKSEKNAFVAKEAIGESVTGGLLTESINLEKPENIDDKIICMENADKLLVFKSLSLGAKGVISQRFEDLDFEDFKDRVINGAIVLVDEEVFKNLKKQSGKNAIIDIENKSVAIL